MENKRVDPVSGNEIPPGATAKEVRDDIPVRVSESEYIIPANVVRYIGLKNIQKLVDEAKEALGDDSEQVDGGEDLEEEEDFPFDPSELEFDEEDDVPELATGGFIDSDFFNTYGDGKSGVKEYRDANGNVMYVPVFNGEPLYTIPSGYTEYDQKAPVTQKTEIDRATGGAKAQPLMDNSSAENTRFVEENKSPLAGNPNDWSIQDFINYGENKDSVANKAMSGMISMLPLGKLAIGARNKYLNSESAELMDRMIDTKLDLQGNPIPEDQLTILSKTRQDMINQMGGQSGLNLSPFDRITDALKSVINFTSNAGTTTGDPRSDIDWVTQANESNSGTGYTYQGGSDRMGSNLPTNTSDNQYSGTSLGGAANADGTPSDSAQDNAQTGSGGLYAKGGFISRKSMKKC